MPYSASSFPYIRNSYILMSNPTSTNLFRSSPAKSVLDPWALRSHRCSVTLATLTSSSSVSSLASSTSSTATSCPTTAFSSYSNVSTGHHVALSGASSKSSRPCSSQQTRASIRRWPLSYTPSSHTSPTSPAKTAVSTGSLTSPTGSASPSPTPRSNPALDSNPPCLSVW